jgi:surfactin synthase thioesterase subunit
LEDGLVDGDGLAAWKEHAAHGFQRYAFPGGHFFLHEAERAVLERVNAELSPFLGELDTSYRKAWS